MLQSPALEPRTAVRKHRDDVPRLDADIALCGVCDERRGSGRRWHRRCRGGLAGGVRGRCAARRGSNAWGGASRRRYGCRRCIAVLRWLDRRFDDDGLPHVEHEEREEEGEENASFHLGRHWVVTRDTKRVTAHESPGGKPASARDAVAGDCLGSVVRAGRQEPAGTRKIWRYKVLVPSEQRERQADAQPAISGHEGVVR